jgi:hypothetical protein
MSGHYLIDGLKRLAKEPPLRLLLRYGLMALPTSVRTKALWELGRRPHYLMGVLAAADQARREQRAEISVVEFGVAGGNGLLALEHWAAAVERETGIRIAVNGFDTGGGLPGFCGDHRDHPDQWIPADFPMDVAALRSRLAPRTKLIIGHIRDTVPAFLRGELTAPVGFAAIDVDLYSSTSSALRLFSDPGRKLLRKTYLYFDDISDAHAGLFHRYAGELLAIDEFNTTVEGVKIDRWHGLRAGRIFPESDWIEKMYVAHDLALINAARPADRAVKQLSLEG